MKETNLYLCLIQARLPCIPFQNKEKITASSMHFSSSRGWRTIEGRRWTFIFDVILFSYRSFCVTVFLFYTRYCFLDKYQILGTFWLSFLFFRKKRANINHTSQNSYDLINFYEMSNVFARSWQEQTQQT